MKKRGFFGIGIQNGKTPMNYGTLFRTAHIFNADFVFVIGKRFQKQATDTMKSYRHLPTFEFTDFQDFNSHRPFGCQLIGVELTPDAMPIEDFNHPEQACYLLGAEDHGLTQEAIQHCQKIVRLPGERSLNVAVAGSIVLYDRINKK